MNRRNWPFDSRENNESGDKKRIKQENKENVPPPQQQRLLPKPKGQQQQQPSTSTQNANLSPRVLIGGVEKTVAVMRSGPLPFPAELIVYGTLVCPLKREDVLGEPDAKTVILLADLKRPKHKLRGVFFSMDRHVAAEQLKVGAVVKMVGRAQSNGTLLVVDYAHENAIHRSSLERLEFISTRALKLGIAQANKCNNNAQ